MLSTNFGSYEFQIRTLTVAGLGLLCSCTKVQGQILGDRLTNTQVKVESNISHVVGGMKEGNNLFHSFKQFSLKTDTIANFDHSLDIQNIFSRVTGGNISEIDGLIQTQGDANLFLINPAGIIFGANAQLNVGGSFIATTAEGIVFKDGTEFSTATENNQPILTISSPIGLQYGSTSEIAVLPNSNRETSNSGVGLSVQPGNTLALLGGDVSIARNSLNAIASNIEISSVKSGMVTLEQEDVNWNFNYDSVREYGRINISNRALINSSGAINVQGKTIDFSNSSGIRNFTSGDAEGGIVNLKAIESITLDSSFLFTQVGEVSSNIDQAISGDGGDVSIYAPNIYLTNGAIISAGTLSDGAGGNITLKASDTVELSSAINAYPSIIITSTTGIGDGGHIDIDTGKLTIYDGSQIQAFAGEGKGGTITVDARELIDLSGTGILQSQDLSGNITETTLKSGFRASSGFTGISFELQPKGESGSLIIDTPQLSIRDSAHISVSSHGLADAGDIRITTANLNLETAGKITANTILGEGGSISVIAENIIALDRQGTISTTAEQSGNGGNIFLEAQNLLLLESNIISANAEQGSGGTISIDTQGLFIEPNSSITADSLVETKEGTVKIITLDLNSRLHMGQKEYSPLIAENIQHGCGGGRNVAQNRFQNIGRGGIPHNPVQETANIDILYDLGTDNKSLKAVGKTKLDAAKLSISNEQPISEANNWKINSQGKIELVAQNNSSILMQSSACQVNK